MDFAKQQGAGAFGTRLRRLSERLDRDVAKLYMDFGVDFEPRWYPVVTLLRGKEPLGVTEIAGALGLSHPAVSQVVKQLAANDLLSSTVDPDDERRKLLSLTKEAHKRIEELTPLWAAIVEVTDEIIKAEVPGLLILLTELDEALETTSLGERVRTRLGLDKT
jgi:DNA-binding MarR family transcriptional regulator